MNQFIIEPAFDANGNAVERVRILDTEDFRPSLIFNCGQCFRFNEIAEGLWRGIAFGKTLRVSGDAIICARGEYESCWRAYLDMDTDYAAIRNEISISAFMREALDFGRGIRILRQDFWETLCSFIISQQNNIPRIKGIIRRLCGGDDRAFPEAGQIAAMSEPELRELGMGYRAPYVLSAAKAYDSGYISADCSREDLMRLPGVGAKVANCVMLYGQRRIDAFPVDVWMDRALTRYFPPGFDHEAEFGQYAGVAQQYIFHYIRHVDKKAKVAGA